MCSRQYEVFSHYFECLRASKVLFYTGDAARTQGLLDVVGSEKDGLQQYGEQLEINDTTVNSTAALVTVRVSDARSFRSLTT